MTTAGEAALAAIAHCGQYDELFPGQDFATIRAWRAVFEAHNIPLSVGIAAVDAWYTHFPGKRMAPSDVALYAQAWRRRESERNRTSPAWSGRSRANGPVLSEIRRHGQTVACRTCKQPAEQPCVNLHDRQPLAMVVHPSRTKDADAALTAATPGATT